MRRIILIITGFSAAISFGQHEYIPMKSEGLMPSVFRRNVAQNVAVEITEQISFTEHYKVKEAKAEFLLKSNYMLYNLLSSGKVVFQDEVTNYVNKVLQNIVGSQDSLVGIEVFVLKSAAVNAFATNQGVIFVTAGLLAKLETEAQLGFILAHEVTHVKKKHSINQFVESDRMFSRSGVTKYSSYEEYIRKMSSYSKSLELEADSVGYKLLATSGYNNSTWKSVFDILEHSYLPFEEIDFPFSAFETNRFNLPERCKLDSLDPIKDHGAESDTKSSHPNIDKRRLEIMTISDHLKSENGLDFLQTESDFNKIKTKCRDEVVRLQLQQGQYVEAFYNANVLLEKAPNSVYYKTSLAKAIYGVSKYKNIYKSKSGAGSEGSISRYYYFFNSLTKRELNLVSLTYLFQLNEELASPVIQLMIQNLTTDLVGINEIKFRQLKFSLDTIITGTALKNNVHSGAEYDSIQLGKFQHVFIDFDISLVQQMFDFSREKVKECEEKEISKENESSQLRTYQVRKFKQKLYHRHRRKGVALGMNKITYVDPEFFEVDERKGVKLINSEKKQMKFVKSISKNAKAAKLDVEVISPKLFTDQSTSSLNDLGTLNSWIGEVLRHKEHGFKYGFISAESEYVGSLAQQYGSNYFCYSGILTHKAKKKEAGKIVLHSMLIYPLFPIAVIYAVTPQYNSIYYSLILNVKSGELEFAEFLPLSVKMNQGDINSLMYDRMLQFKKVQK